MANTVKVIIDGKEIQAAEGMNLIDAAELGGIHIPNLCYLKGLKGVGACRICLVEIEGMKTPMIACTTRVKEGMSVNTKTEAVEEVRKFVTDLIVSMHPLDCMTCTKAGICKLQDYAYDFGIKESSFTRKKTGFGIDDSNPFIKLDPDYCVLCSRCVRICKHQGTNVLEFKGRGVGSKVIAGSDQPLHESGCTFCGSCIDVCPVNAILEADRWRKGREWDYEKTASTCLLCGNGCDIVVNTRDGMVRKINAGAENGLSEKYICARGRFGFDAISGDLRVPAPLKRVNGELIQTTWQDAIDIVASRLKESADNSGIVTTAGIVNEDALTIKKFATEALKTKNLDTTASLYSDKETLLSETADLESADLFVLVDLNPDQRRRMLPALDAIIRKRINLGAKLITLRASEPRISSVAAVNLIGDEPELLKSFIKAIAAKGVKADEKLAEAVSGASVDELTETAAALFVDAKNPVILTSPAMYAAASNISLLKGSTVSVPLESNAKGVVMMGLTTEGKSYQEMMAGGVKSLFVVGEVPVNQRPAVDFLVVQSSYMTDLAKQADVVLPSLTYLEADGTIVDYLGRLKSVANAVSSNCDAKTHREIIVALAKAMGAEIKEAKESEVKKAAKVKIKTSFSPFTRKEGLGTKHCKLMDSLNESVINGSRLLWLKENEKAKENACV